MLIHLPSQLSKSARRGSRIPRKHLQSCRQHARASQAVLSRGATPRLVTTCWLSASCLQPVEIPSHVTQCHVTGDTQAPRDKNKIKHTTEKVKKTGLSPKRQGTEEPRPAARRTILNLAFGYNLLYSFTSGTASPITSLFICMQNQWYLKNFSHHIQGGMRCNKFVMNWKSMMI